MGSSTIRSILLFFLITSSILIISSNCFAQSNSLEKVPVIVITDLYHPDQDPGDNFDLISTVDWAGNESVNNTDIVVSTLNATSLNNYQKVDDKLIVAPNPSNGLIKLSGITLSNGAIVKIYSPDGRLAFQKSFETIDDKVVIDLTGHAPGLYSIVLFHKNEILKKETFMLL